MIRLKWRAPDENPVTVEYHDLYNNLPGERCRLSGSDRCGRARASGPGAAQAIVAVYTHAVLISGTTSSRRT
jgi:hypothetical protein